MTLWCVGTASSVGTSWRQNADETVSLTDWDGLALTCTGTGDSVLWLHGYTMSAEVWAPLWHLLPGWRHLGLDLPWHGSSRDLRRDESLADLADSVVAYAAAAGVSHVVGAQRSARRRSDPHPGHSR